jgi:hypothetical protein
MMKKRISTLTLTFLLTVISPLFGESEPVNIVDIGKLDRTMTQHKAQKRHFKNKEEFKRHQHLKREKNHAKQRQKKADKHLQRKHHREYAPTHYRERGYDDRIYDFDRPYWYRHHGRSYRHPKRGWILAYRYDRAAFYDRDGFHYGYFNRYGFMFEGEFYRYDRYYRYRDRIRGRGLFDRYYYRPAKWRYYGFCR